MIIDANTLSVPYQVESTRVLGHNQKQNGSVLQAGARALLIPSEITKALCSSQGRIAAQTIMMMGASEKLLNYAALRPYAIMEVIRRHFPHDVENPVILDPTTGYGPEYIWLAQDYPQAQFIEMDRPDVIRDKVQRLKRFSLPPNLSYEGVDLARIPLHEALDGRQVNMMVVLGTYVHAADFGELLLYLRSVLAPGGIVIAPFPYQVGLSDFVRANIVFGRFTSASAGVVNNSAEVDDIFRRAGYQDISVYTFTELARDLNKPEPYDIELIGVGRVG